MDMWAARKADAQRKVVRGKEGGRGGGGVEVDVPDGEWVETTAAESGGGCDRREGGKGWRRGKEERGGLERRRVEGKTWSCV